MMNISCLLQFESMAYRGSQTQSLALNQFVASALRVFIVDFYQRMAPSFMLIISCRRRSPWNFYRQIMQLLYESVDNMILQLIYHDHNNQSRRIPGPRLHNLLLVDSLQALLDIEIHTYTSQLDGSEYYFIFLQQRDALIQVEMRGIFEYCWRHQLLNCNVMTQSAAGEILMHTYFPYAATNCGAIPVQQINRFVGIAWEKNIYFPAKLHNLHGCPLQILLRPIVPFVMLEQRLLQELARRMNFSMHLVQNHSTEQQILQLLEEQRAHLAIGYMRKRVEHSFNLTAVFPHYSSRLVGCLPLNAHNLTSLQLLGFPFQSFAWLAVLLSLLATGCVMLWSRLEHTERTSDLLSVLAIAWGQPALGNAGMRNVAQRMLSINWLCGTQLLRAMYMALFFYMLRHHIHQRLPRTLHEMTESGYVAVMNRITADDLQGGIAGGGGVGAGAAGIVIISSEREQDVLRLLQELESSSSSRRIFGILSQQTLLHAVQHSRCSGAYYVLPQNIVEQQLAIYLQKHSHLVQRLDELIIAIRSVGLLHYWAGQMGSERYFRSMLLPYQDKRLRQPDLWAIYFIMAGLYFLATLLLLGELISARWRQHN
ncbi:uncharacterized protein LOC116805958 [Drosophila grimshawi]|uniref:uncharacterized protein LOC116805958 n=1 Tax=Drosophila grimshawi TaxID=7222 RepID=UPI0013EEF9A7|nr:uncharacterized protein LOC116805958 [Drosophila grimshawi]